METVVGASTTLSRTALHQQDRPAEAELLTRCGVAPPTDPSTSLRTQLRLLARRVDFAIAVPLDEATGGFPQRSVSPAGVLYSPYEERRHASVLSVAKDQNGCWALRGHKTRCESCRHSLHSASPCPRTDCYAHFDRRASPAAPHLPDETTGGFPPNGQFQPLASCTLPTRSGGTPVGCKTSVGLCVIIRSASPHPQDQRYANALMCPRPAAPAEVVVVHIAVR